MNPKTSPHCILFVLVLFFTLPAAAQTNRWLVSFNPFGLLEINQAIGAGAGFKLNRQVELWAEFSKLQRGLYVSDDVQGFRQIVQGKYFPGSHPNFFIALEIRYKSYDFLTTGNFVNTVNGQTLTNYPYRLHRWFWGIGSQWGYRHPIGEKSGLALEITTGIGFKHTGVEERGVPKDFRDPPAADEHRAENWSFVHDVNVYLPGSLRLIWMFGRKMSFVARGVI